MCSHPDGPFLTTKGPPKKPCLTMAGGVSDSGRGVVSDSGSRAADWTTTPILVLYTVTLYGRHVRYILHPFSEPHLL